MDAPAPRNVGRAASGSRAPGRLPAALCLGLVLATAAVYRAVGDFAFVYDDEAFIPFNEHVLGGLSWRGLRWAFTTGYTANWHPLTWISHMLDVQLFGLDAGAHHLVSLALHLVAVALLFLVLRRLTGAVWESVAAAALFGIHPVHVESVAWVAERKDVLSALFWILGLAAYARYAAKPGPGRYAVVAGCLALGLMSKPMAVTFPLVLLLLDWWPLGRLRARPPAAAPWRRLALEKVPLLLLAAAAGIVTILTQQSFGAVASASVYRPLWRVEHALLTYVAYLGKTLWPSRLAFFYPYRPGAAPLAALLGALAVLGMLSALAVGVRSRRPWLLVGWLWYLVTLLPVIGLLQVGGQAMADRYLHLPLVGLGIAATWSAGAVARLGRTPRLATACGALLALLALAVTASRQAEHWRSPESLFRHALAVTEENWVAHEALAIELYRQGKGEEALLHYREAARINPSVLQRTKFERMAEAVGATGEIQRYRDDLARRQGTAPEYYRLGNGLAAIGRYPEALEAFEKAARLEPGNADIRNDLGSTLAMLGRRAEAETAFREALRLRPGHAAAQRNLDLALGPQRTR